MPRGVRNRAASAAPAAPAVPSVEAGALETQEVPSAPVSVEEPAKPYDYSSLSAAQRENPECLVGDDLRRLAYQRGISRSEAGRMSDQKLRIQLRYLTYRQYDET
jgi:hypothetical protein